MTSIVDTDGANGRNAAIGIVDYRSVVKVDVARL
jgi:hypothetical protein